LKSYKEKMINRRNVFATVKKDGFKKLDCKGKILDSLIFF